MKNAVPVLAAALVLAACNPDLEVPNLNNPSAGGSATRSSVIANAQGLIGNVRGMSTGSVITFGVWGRELYSLAPEEPRPFTDNLIGPRDPNSSGSGAYFNYGTIVQVRALLQAVDAVSGMTDQEKEAVRGWGNTIAGFAYFQTALAYTEFGAPLEPPENPTGELSPIATGPELYAKAISLFDEGYQQLQAGGSAFPFSLTPGYAGFDAPSTFAKVNRALKARTLKYMGQWADVLTALGQSFIDPSGDLDMGAWNSYFAADNAFNPFNDPRTQYVHPRFLQDAQLKANGQKDDRATSKTEILAAPPPPYQGVAVTEGPNMYPTSTSPFPWITNEELILLRAEAKLGSGDAPGALADVNIIRTRAGGLDPVSGLTGTALLDEILYNKFYSLIWRGGFTYWDAKQYDRLDQLPRALPSHVVFNRVNWPSNECIQRSMTTGPCGPIDGF
jgi:starch-binding outer membrane protein, SusD/RagB family